jgi:hypothetical protein
LLYTDGQRPETRQSRAASLLSTHGDPNDYISNVAGTAMFLYPALDRVPLVKLWRYSEIGIGIVEAILDTGK